MIALPSIAFGGFSGSAKGVTARFVGGRSILSVRSYPTGAASNAQVVRRASVSRITKSFKLLSDERLEGWRRLADRASGQSVFGQRANLSVINLYVHLNSNREMAGEPLLLDAPVSLGDVSPVSYGKHVITPSRSVFCGIEHQGLPYKMVVKMSEAQSVGVSSGWSRTVIISSSVEDDWGEADVTELYLRKLGVSPSVGRQVCGRLAGHCPDGPEGSRESGLPAVLIGGVVGCRGGDAWRREDGRDRKGSDGSAESIAGVASSPNDSTRLRALLQA